MLKELDDDQKDFGREVATIEREMKYLEQGRKVPMPGAALSTMLNKWAEEPIDSPVQFSEYILGLWKSREQFEQELREEERGIYMFV